MPVAGNGPTDPLLELLDALPDVAIVTDAASPQRIRWASGSYLELTGARPDELLGHPLAERCSHDASSEAFEPPARWRQRRARRPMPACASARETAA